MSFAHGSRLNLLDGSFNVGSVEGREGHAEVAQVNQRIPREKAVTKANCSSPM